MLLPLILFYFHLNYLVASLLMLVPLRSFGALSAPEAPKVSVIITTRNEEAVIEKTLRSVREMNYPNFEVIVVDSSTDSTAKIARRYARVIKDRKAAGKPHSLNLAVKHAKGEILYILDADSVPERNALKKLVAALRNGEAAAGMSLVRNKETLTARIARLQETFFNSIQTVSSHTAGTIMLTGKNFVIRKKTLERLGGFGDVLAEDIDLSVRLYNAKIKVAFVDAKCFGQAPPRLGWYLRQQKRWSYGGSTEVGKFFLSKDPARLLFWGPLGIALGFSYIFALLFFIHFLATGSWVSLSALLLATIMYFISAARFLDADDFLLVPATLLSLGALQSYIILDAISAKIAGKEIKWERTPKVR